MKKHLKFLTMALVAIVACVSHSSCSKDEEDPNDGWADYYFQLYSVETNLLDKDGNNIAISLMNGWKDEIGADSEYRKTIGHCDKYTAHEWFDQTIRAYANAYRASYCGTLPKNGFINFTFSLRDYKDVLGAVWDDVIIEVTNDNVTIK